MRTVLYAWELGANLGHLLPLARIAGKLNGDGHEAVFAVLDIGMAQTALGTGPTVLQAPVWPTHRHFGARGGAASYADSLGNIGFGDPAKLAAMIGAWSTLCDRIKPDVVVADYSPGLLVALHGRNIPIVSVGSALAMPPVERDQFPPLRGDTTPAIPEPRLLESMRRAQAMRGHRPAADLLGPFRTAARVVFGVPELDPYQSFRQEPLAAPPGGFPPPQPWTTAPRLFVYVGADLLNFETFAQALSLLKVPTEAYLRGDGGPVPDFLRLRGMTVHDTPPPLGEVLVRCSHVLTQGGAMTSATAFAAGRPQLVIPGHDEAEMNLTQLQRYGVAERLDVTDDPRAVAGAITDFINATALSERAHEIAHRLAGRPVPDGADVAADAVRRFLG